MILITVISIIIYQYYYYPPLPQSPPGIIAGFEQHVGSRTTYDYLNSFPHVRGLEILPRTNTKIIHGMAVELWGGVGGETRVIHICLYI